MKRILLNLGHSQGCPVAPILCMSCELHGGVFYSRKEARKGAELLPLPCPCSRTSRVMVSAVSCGGQKCKKEEKKGVEKPDYLQAAG